MKSVTLLVPCYNEEKSLPIFYDVVTEVINRISKYNWEILFIDDGSKDKTLDIIKILMNKDHRVKFISLSRNFGKEAAMMSGLDHVFSDAVIIMDADLQDPPSLISEMVDEWQNGFEDVYAKRLNRGEETWLRKFLSIGFYNIFQKITDIDILPNVGDFRLLDRKCIQALQEIRESERYTKGLFSWIGFRKKEILFNRGDRFTGKSAWKFKGLFNLALKGLTSFSNFPLRMISFIGFLISFCAFIYLIFIFVRTLIYGDEVRGFPTLIIIILFLGGIQLLALGVIGEYIGRIFIETKNRPNYFIREKNL